MGWEMGIERKNISRHCRARARRGPLGLLSPTTITSHPPPPVWGWQNLLSAPPISGNSCLGGTRSHITIPPHLQRMVKFNPLLGLRGAPWEGGGTPGLQNGWEEGIKKLLQWGEKWCFWGKR